MIRSLTGTINQKKESSVVLEVQGIGFRVQIPEEQAKKLKVGKRVKLMCFLHVRQGELELYGFLRERELELFEALTALNGIGPKAALKVVGSVKQKELESAIRYNRADVLMESAHIGKKTAERILFGMRGTLTRETKTGENGHNNEEVKAALGNLGYAKKEINKALAQVSPKVKTSSELLRAALKRLGNAVGN